MVDAPADGSDGSGGTSGGGKRPPPSSTPLSPGSPAKRHKAEVTAKGDVGRGKPEEEVPVVAAAEEEAGTSSRSPRAPWNRPRPSRQQPAATGSQAVEPVPWATLKSYNQKIAHDHLIFDTEFYVGRSGECNICFMETSRVLCKLRRLEKPGRCLLQVKGKTGLVELNGSKIDKGENRHLLEGDKVAFCTFAYIFQPNNTVPISASATLCCQDFKNRLKQGILGPDANQVTFGNFKYYLSENTKKVLLSAALVHMENKSRHMEKELVKSLLRISSINPRILLTGPSGSEIYQETLIKALAKNFDARLLIVDSLLLPDSSGDQEAETLGIDELMEVISEESINSTLIVFKDVEKTLTGRTELLASLGNELPHGVLIIGSHTEKDSPKDKSSCGSKLQERNKDATKSMKYLENLFPNKISIELPKDEAQLSELKKKLKLDAENLRAKANTYGTHESADKKAEERAKDEDRSGDDESRHRTWRYMPSVSVRACITALGAAGERLQSCSTFLAGYHAPMTQIGEFMRRVGTYAPCSTLVGETPATLGRIAKACGNIGSFFGHAASTIEGATAMGKMIGAGLQNIARFYGPEVTPEPDPKPEASSEPVKLIINTLEQAREVLEWILEGHAAAVQVDVGLDVTPATAVNIFNEFSVRGSEALALISGGVNMMAKRSMYHNQRRTS